jgi:glutamate-1-semialdehyde 2,1-aminomutase
MSFGAFGGRADPMALHDPAREGALPHAGTFNDNALSMVAGVAALAEVFPPEEAEALHARGERLRERLNAAVAARGPPLHPSGTGSLMSLHGCGGPWRGWRTWPAPTTG